MGASCFRSCSRRWANTISSIASRLFFLLIIFQVPLFRVPCRSGICINPIQITSCQLIASEILPVALVKIILYPGAIVNALIQGTNLPKYGNLLDIYNLTHVKDVPAAIDLWRLEILAGSYFSVAGALLGLLKQGRLSSFGMVLLLWGLVKEVLRQKATHLESSGAVQVSPVMLIALLTALSSVKGDVKEIIQSFRAHQMAKRATEFHEHIKKRRKEREMKRLEWTVNYVNSSKVPRNTKVAQEGINQDFLVSPSS